MSSEILDELREFHRFLGEKLTSGADLSPEEALDAWRERHPVPAPDPEEVAAIREALKEVDSGKRGKTWEEFDRDLRKRYPFLGEP